MRKKLLRSRSGFEKPESREEAIMQNILGASNVLEPAESNIEEILQAILYNTPYTKEPETNIEEILLAIKNNGTYTGECESRDMKILFAILNESTYNEEPESRIEELFIEWLYQRSSIKVLEGVPPLIFTSRGLPLINYLIEGNTVQSGNPTPQNPVSVQGVGELETSGEHSGEYKIQISNGQQTTNIYLGSTQTVRAIKKLVLDGTEKWWVYSGDGFIVFYSADVTDYLKKAAVTCLCTHYHTNSNVSAASQVQEGVSFITISSAYRLYIRDSSISSVNDLRSWLAAQYANGTPVTIWYVLATPETTTVNEPLMKVGDYADTISMTDTGISIPTVHGNNVLTVDTTVQPSNVYIEYK
jgi:hypothetical protein